MSQRQVSPGSAVSRKNTSSGFPRTWQLAELPNGSRLPNQSHHVHRALSHVYLISMAIVSRRALQRLINDCEESLTLAQRQRLAGGLNRGGPESLAFEWEVLVLAALSRSTVLIHEPDLGTRRPDILATVHDSSEVFIADIATHFLDSTHYRNPIEDLHQLVSDRARQRHGMSGNGFQIEVDGHYEGARGKQRMKLHLPARKDLRNFFLLHVAPFVDAVAAARLEFRIQVIRTEGVDFTISYHPGQQSSGLRYPSYTVHYSRTNNPIFGILKSKTDQLKSVPFDGPRCVILCGADASLPRRTTGTGFGLAEITLEFFRQNTSLSAVLTMCSGRPPLGGGTSWLCELYENPTARHPLGPNTVNVLITLSDGLPKPLRDGPNALHRLNFWRTNRGRFHLGDFRYTRSMTETTIKMSSRELMELLAGHIDHDELLGRHGTSSQIAKVFAAHLKEGRLLEYVCLERRPDHDDDWIVFRFGPADPAIAPLKAR